jgi:acetyl-CoA carboxylase biotin carboxylase subunit
MNAPDLQRRLSEDGRRTQAREIRRVLVANRGEIAVRVQRACRELGVETVQVYSEADRDSLAVLMADRSVCIGPARSSDSYLRPQLIVDAARALGADAVHPGYGFLSENAKFAAMCAEAGLTFIGPSPEAIAAMGDKARARVLADEAGVPTTPGSPGKLADLAAAMAAAERVGFPLMLKAAAGGGGRGMRVVQQREELATAFADATREAVAAFGDGAMYLERFMPRIRHVEIQVLSDGHDVLHLGERDCSAQRRNQKLVEESPSPRLDRTMFDRMADAAVRLCRHVGYTSAGTIECIVDMDSTAFYFMEMNTRVQVEHPVTELVTGIDIVKEQIRIARGERLGISQRDVLFSGHSIECRINAEDPDHGFRPMPGVLTAVQFPGGPGVRVDSHVYPGYRVPPHYDSLLAKLICWGRDRDEALARMRRALDELRIEGIKTTASFQRRLLDTEAFRKGEVHTRFVENWMSTPA